MDPNFKFFYPGVCDDDQPIYGLVDMIDNHFMIQSYDASALFNVRELIKSKTLLEIVNISKYRYNEDQTRITDNWVIENWGIDLRQQSKRIDPLTSKVFDHLNKKECYLATIPDAQIVPSTIEFDAYKHDLQKQIFFLYFFVNHDNFSPNTKAYLVRAIQTSLSYQQMLDQFLNVQDAPFAMHVEMLRFLKLAGALYE